MSINVSNHQLASVVFKAKQSHGLLPVDIYIQ